MNDEHKSRSVLSEAADFLYMAWGYVPEDARAKCKQLEEALRDAPVSETQPIMPDEVKQLVDALTSYEQADMDGVMVTVSRQACDEAAELIRARYRSE